MSCITARRVAIAHGAVPPDAPPDEQDVLVEVQAVQDALQRRGYIVRTVPVDLNLAAAAQQLIELRTEVVFNLVESVAGRGILTTLGPLLFDHIKLPYTGVPLTALFVTSNKVLAKQCLAAAGIPTAPWTSTTPQDIGPWIVKSVWEHASIGLDDHAVLYGARAVEQRLAACRARGGEWFAEKFIAGREFNVSLVDMPDGVRVLPLAEIVFDAFPEGKPRIVNYAAKWDAESFEYHNTPRRFIDEQAELELASRLREIALRCWKAFDLRGYARVDFRVDAAGAPWVLEINGNPCVSPDAGFAAAAAQAGIEYDELIEQIVRAAWGSS